MAQVAGADETESMRFELEEMERNMRSSFRNSRGSSKEDDEVELQWAAIERLPTFDRLRSSLFDCREEEEDYKGKKVIDVTKIGAIERRLFIEKLIKHIENDNRLLLEKQRERIDRVGVKLPTVEVRYKNLCVEAECEIVDGKPLPTLWNTAKSIFFGFARLPGSKSQEAKINIIKDVSGFIKPSRMTLLLGPPGCGKTTLLLALAGKLNQSLKLSGEISYNGYELDDFVPQKTSAYISQYDLHIPEMTVRETLDFSARCQGVGSRSEIMMEVCRREKESGIVPEPDIDTYMKAISVEGLKRSLQTEYILKILGLDICADTMAGDAMRRGISGGQKKRLTTGRMVLPFEPLTMTFQDVQYYIDTPLELREQGFTQKSLQLLCDISGAFRPGVLTALMGVSGAGKTTLMDVLSGRKTGGMIEGDIRIEGYPKVQGTFARISGYCEQTDIHSPQITIEESVIYSAWLRLPREINEKTKFEFVNEVLQTIELDGIKDALVGIPGVSGLSTEQRKRLTVAVELVSNPSIIFMDEPTSGLDARSAAIVMRAVKNVADTGRTVVCTIHQPSIDIFETFNELILMKRGGQIIYSGPLGLHSSRVIEYFEGITGVPKIRENYNPATWMLEATSDSIERQLGADFASIFKESSLYKDTIDLVKQLSTPPLGSKDLHFPTQFPQNGWGQFRACLWKQHLSYWRSPAYNLIRLIFVVIASVVYGALFWQHGKKINDQQDLFTILGTMYSAMIFLGISNCSSVLPFIVTERTVLYREKFAGMYSSWAYSFAQVSIELPYIFIQTVLFVIITYPTIGYYWSAYKIFWYFYAMFCTLLYYNYLGMLLMALSPTAQVASITASSCYCLLNLFSGFIIPGPQFPMWWRWFYYICPSSWTLYGLFTSQYGDIEKEIFVFGETKSIASFLKDYFGFHHNHLGVVAIILIAFPLLFASLFAHCIGKLNFQRR